MANDNSTQNVEKPLIEIGNMSTVDVAHFGTDDDDPTGAKAAGGLVNSDEAGPQEDSGDRPGSFGAGAGGGGSNAGPAREGDAQGDDSELV